jgi:hypothetical protein
MLCGMIFCAELSFAPFIIDWRRGSDTTLSTSEWAKRVVFAPSTMHVDFASQRYAFGGLFRLLLCRSSS